MLITNFSPFPILETDRLVLRTLTHADAPEMFRYRSSETIMKYIARPRAKTIEDAIVLIDRINTNVANNEGINWGITLNGSEKTIGYIGYMSFRKEDYRAEIGYLLSDEFHRQGIMQEAIRAVLAYGFNEIGLHSVSANVDPENIASLSILEKIGFKREAYFREDFYYDGKFLDSVILSLLGWEFESNL